MQAFLLAASGMKLVKPLPPHSPPRYPRGNREAEDIPHLLSRKSVLRMALVMAHEHHPDMLGANFEKEMIGKAGKIHPPETLIHEVKPERVFCGSVDEAPYLGKKFLGQPAGNFLVVGQCLLDVRPHQRVINYFHVARSRSMEAQNSSELSGRTRPDSNSSRRRADSATLSAFASS